MNHARRHELGLSMVEMLVAVTVLVVAGLIALMTYDAARKSFKTGENATEQQQGTRIAFDRLIADLRMAGFNSDPDGDPNRPDEQIEAAYDTAIVIRADFDAEDPTASTTPEATLPGTAFLTVSTGNDEIVAYVLAKPDGSDTGSLGFGADVKDAPRDGAIEAVSIPNVAMVQNDPPYTLYRVTLNNDVSSWGSAGFFTRTPLADNIRSMRFRYYDTVGSQINSTFDLTTPTDDIGGGESTLKVNQRKAIKRIGIELEGMTKDPDLNWTDPTDTDPDTQKHRKFLLTGDVTPRNLGLKGIRDLSMDVTPPSKPATPTLIPGHCGALFMTWTANPIEEQVTSYRVNYGTTSGTYSAQRTTSTNSLYLPGLADATTYYVQILALDAAGNISVPSNEASATTADVNVPEAPLNLTASTDLTGAVRLQWDKVINNTAAQPAADPGAPRIRDLAGYRVYRKNGPSMVSWTLIADETTVGNESSPDYNDTEVVACHSYTYKVTAVDQCGNESADSGTVAGNSTTTTAPKAPDNVQAFFYGLGSTKITWDPVTEDVTDSPIFIDSYDVYRSGLIPEGDKPTDPSSFTLLGTVTGLTEYIDSGLLPTGYVHWYAVKAKDECVNYSALSDPTLPTCAFSGDVVFVTPIDGQPVSGVVPVTVEVQNGFDVYTEIVLEFYNRITGQIEDSQTLDGPGPVWTYNWLADPPGPYVITATVENDQECFKTATIEVAAGTSVGCCLSPPNPDLDPVVMECVGPGKDNVECKEVSWELINNNCLTAVAIDEIAITWVDNVQNNPKLTGVRFDAELIWAVTPPSLSPAINTWDPITEDPPSIPVSRDSNNPVQVTYIFDQVTSKQIKKQYYRDTMTTSFSYTLLNELDERTAISGVCGPKTGIFDNFVVEVHK